ncbi:GntR family transcriptional regulator [Lactobacillus delbrueckii]|uniref:GntR family transcriptional regulator n=1 Tax=Lactobacillus delbrueckii TaxID=1584 RepID=UPI00069B5CC5|nr:GntR family transcriptional regulator [Lactobacillus delbrueckii]APP10136.1 GntR family transcriptional regulator [Lactobacillus delbrueckii subsp. delbrueckii DSM 20074 = JCM 1012]KNZ37700.1 GntR family transcriptional regulator [Lactobacillus delbrueckii subsp. delbrueckii]MCT3493646.1 GntR family transcriptional regulator [Lactobacillus delbrueckii]MCT3522257.1 GntR family transcriptional regulator [Lactobacillus delbrueckii]
MKFKDNLPIYLQIEDYIYLQIAQGKLQAGEKLPSVRALALELTVNANTVQRALREMTAKGYIFTKRGEGSFVTTDEGLLEEMKSKLLKQELAAFVSRMEKLGVKRESLTGLLASYLDDTREE